MAELYRSTTTLVRSNDVAGSAALVVAFNSYVLPAGLHQQGFGETFCRERSIPAVHVISAANDWYQQDDLAQALGAIRRHAAGYERIVAYGSSMGGYAAIRHAGAIGAHAVLALSPQYSIDPRRVPWEYRWAHDAALIGWRDDADGMIVSPVAPVICYEPGGLDERHVDRIAADIAVRRVPIGGGGHPVTTLLADTGTLQELVLSAVAGEIDEAKLTRSIRARCHGSSVYLAELSHRNLGPRPRLALRLAEQAVRVSGGSELALYRLGEAYLGNGRGSDAVATLETVVALSGRSIGYLHPLGCAKAVTGDLAGAIAIGREMLAIKDDMPWAWLWLGHIQERMGHHEAALLSVSRARRLTPGDPLVVARYRRLRRERLTRPIVRAVRALIAMATRLRRSRTRLPHRECR